MFRKKKREEQLGTSFDRLYNYNYDNSQHTIENHFSITGDNPKQIANEVSRILQRQVNRRNATWV